MEKGIAEDLEKIEAIRDWPTPNPNNFTDVISFMGITGYYRWFIKGFSSVANPITSLQKKRVKFVWIQQCQENFDKLKNVLPTSLVLKIDNPYKEFVVCTGVSKEGVAGVLTQESHVIHYESRKLKYYENNYALHHLELIAIIHAF